MDRLQLSPILATSRAALRALTILTLVAGTFILALLIASLLAEAQVMRALGVNLGGDNSMLFLGMRLIAVIGIGSVPLAYVIFKRLLAIIETVSLGDPFVAENAGRLKTIAWALFGLEVLHLVVGTIAAVVSTQANPLDINWHFSITGWLAVLLLFVLARVFDCGTRMREDLEGTV